MIDRDCWGASGAGLSPRGGDATGICRGSRTPGLSALPVTTCEVVAIEGVEPSTQQFFRLLALPLSYIAVVVKIAFARYTQRQGRSAPVWLEPQPQTRMLSFDLGTDEREPRSPEILVIAGIGDRLPAHPTHERRNTSARDQLTYPRGYASSSALPGAGTPSGRPGSSDCSG